MIQGYQSAAETPIAITVDSSTVGPLMGAQDKGNRDIGN